MSRARPGRTRGAVLRHHPILMFLVAIICLSLGPRWTTAQVRTEDPGDRGTRELLKLIPPDSGVVLTVDDLRGQVHAFLDSRLAGELQRMPVVKAWFDSEHHEQLETAQNQIEGMLQAKVTQIRDEVLGDAVVFALRLPPDHPADPAHAQGLLVLKARDPVLLKRLIDLLNTIQRNNGELAAVVDRKRGDTSYAVRRFAPGSNHTPDAYVAFADGTFAISNSEDLVGVVIDRKMAKADPSSRSSTSFDITEKYGLVDRSLPGGALARLVVDARLIETMIKNKPQPRSAGAALLERYLGALNVVGAALVVQEDGLAVRTAELFDPRKVPEQLGRLAVGPGASPSAIDRVPATALGVGTVRVDLAALYELLLPLVPETERTRLTNMEAVLQGISLGQNLRTRILPGLGPKIIAYLDAPVDWEPGRESAVAPGPGWPFSSVLVVELKAAETSDKTSRGPVGVTIAEAVDNALNTILALVTLDDKRVRGRARPRIVTREVSGVAIKTLDPPVPFAFAVDRPGHRLVVSTSPAAVERYLIACSGQEAGTRFRRLKATAFADAPSYLCLDFAAVQTTVDKHRDRLIEMIASHEHRSRQDVTRDIDQMLAFARIFDAAFLTVRYSADSTTVFHTLGLLVRPVAKTDPVAQP